MKHLVVCGRSCSSALAYACLFQSRSRIGKFGVRFLWLVRIQELESIFRGAGWNVIKVIWGDDWDHLLAKDTTGLLAKRMNEVVDGQYQKYTGMPGSYIREHFFGKYPELLKLVENYSDEKLEKMRRGGHDPEKVYAAYKTATELNNGKPTVILAKTVKGYGLGEAGEGRNVAHNQKKSMGIP